MPRMRWLSLLLASASVAGCGPDSTSLDGEPLGYIEQAVHDDCPPANPVLGIDIASYQHPGGAAIDWATVAANRRFVIIKATEGTGYVNSYYADDSVKARAAGMIVGAYHWLNYNSTGQAQADAFLAAMGGTVADGDLPPMLDVEETNGSVTAAQRVATMKAWLDRVEQVIGRKPMIYSGTWYWSGYLGNPTGYGGVYPMVWAAYVSGCPSVPDDFPGLTMWQYLGGGGTTPGIAAACDQDKFYGTEADLLALANNTGADVQAMLQGPAAYAPPRNTDVDGDGKADLCARGWGGLRCFLSRGATFEETTILGDLSDPNGWTDQTNWATLRMGDINGDHKADACARANDGVSCWTSNGTGWDGPVPGPALGDAQGWNRPEYFTTIRLADVNGDGNDDVCARAGAGFNCWPSSGTGFGAAFADAAWSDAAGFDKPQYYGTLRTADIDGDGDDDACIRSAAGVDCVVSEGSTFGAHVPGPVWTDSNGWDAAKYWSTIRLADVNGDGMADLCARTASDLRCHFATGSGFGDATIVAELSDASGWGEARFYATLRAGDIDGNGSDDLCIRSSTGVACYVWNGSTFDARTGPSWGDAQGFTADSVFHTLRLGDANGDRQQDLCVRSATGWQCELSTGAGFSGSMALDELTDQGGWDVDRYYGTIQFAGPTCRHKPEICNGQDDDCDGEIDEGVCSEPGVDAGGDSAVEPEADAGGDAAPDAGAPPAANAPAASDTADGCACRFGAGTTRPSLGSALLLGLVALALRRRTQTRTR